MDPINTIAGNPESTPQTSTSNQPQGNPEKKDSNSLTVASVAIFVILSLGIIAFLYYQNQQLKGMLASYQTPVASPTPTQKSDPTLDWESYISPKKDYTFKHPTELKSDTGAAGTAFESIRFTFMGPKQIASGRTQTELFDGYTFTVTKLGLKTSVDPKSESEKQFTDSKEFCQNMESSVKTKVNDLDGYSITCPDNYVTTFLSDSKNTFSLTQFFSGDDSQKYKTITSQMLSTFKFLETPSASPTATPKIGISPTPAY